MRLLVAGVLLAVVRIPMGTDPAPTVEPVPVPVEPPPPAVKDLEVVEAGETTLVLTWTSPGPYTYEVRRSTAGPILDESGWKAAIPVDGIPPGVPAGEPVKMTVTGLTPEQTYWFCLRSIDENGNQSPLSNSPSGTTLPASDATPPAAVVDLAVAETLRTRVILRWTAPGDDGTQGVAAAYDLRYSASGPILTEKEFLAAAAAPAPAPAPGGTPQYATIVGLTPGATYWFALRSRDEVFNWSGMSNNPSATLPLPGSKEARGCSSSAGGSTPPLFVAALMAALAAVRIRRLNLRASETIVYAEATCHVVLQGGRCMVYLKDGAILDLIGGTHTVYYEPGARISNPGSGDRLIKCRTITFRRPQASEPAARPVR